MLVDLSIKSSLTLVSGFYKMYINIYDFLNWDMSFIMHWFGRSVISHDVGAHFV